MNQNGQRASDMQASRGTATLVWVVVTVAVVVMVSAMGWHHWVVPAVAAGVLVGLWVDARTKDGE